MLALRLPFPQRSIVRHLPLFAATAFLTGIFQLPAQAETSLKCDAPGGVGATLFNSAASTYADGFGATFFSLSQQISSQFSTSGALSLSAQGLRDKAGKLLYGTGTAAYAIKQDLKILGYSEEDASKGSLTALLAFIELPADASLQQTLAAVKTAINQAVPNQANTLSRSGGAVDQKLALNLMGLGEASLESIGISTTDRQVITDNAIAAFNTNSATAAWSQAAKSTVDATIQAVPTQTALLTETQQSFATDLTNLKAKTNTAMKVGDTVRFEFKLTNSGTAPITIQLPTVEEIQQNELTSAIKVTAVSIEQLPPQTSVTLNPGQQVKLLIDTQVSELPKAGTGLAIAFKGTCGGTAQTGTFLLPPTPTTLIDPFGRITGCDGELLTDYRGFSVALYRPASNTGEIGSILRLPQTELPDNPNNRIPAGLEPNEQNSNPFFLVNADEGKYNFLMSPNQLKKGAVYILLVKPPEDSNYDERRIKIEIGDRTTNGFSYRATSLDGRPISASNRRNVVSGTLKVSEATQVGLILALVDLDTGVCQAEAIQITKTGDRVTAQPGDTVVYRLMVRNLSTTAIETVTITDRPPLGFHFLDESVRGAMGDRTASITVKEEGGSITFQLRDPLPAGGVVNLAYAAQLTPDAIRGDGLNSANVRGRREDNDWVIRDGPAIHRLRIEPGILSDCGTILGRVFEDKNFDGEQQPGEPGIPNAVIFLDDGNRITTDTEGLFSVQKVLPGYRNGTLDLTSLPGYTLAPNTRFIERNSPSRLVHLSPGGLVRMNFAVTPTFQEEAGQ